MFSREVDITIDYDRKRVTVKVSNPPLSLGHLLDGIFELIPMQEIRKHHLLGFRSAKRTANKARITWDILQ